jgi:glycosyltransferase involved in cell wall biosynthesis
VSNRDPDRSSEAKPLAGFRACIIYDCLFPWTIGGAERWYRYLAERLVDAGAEVTYLTRRQWEDEGPQIAGVTVIDIMPPTELYLPDGTRRNLPPLRFGWSAFRWLIQHRGEVDTVQLANFPYFSLFAVRLALLGTGTPIGVDWFEVWPREFWISYAGGLLGRAGFLIQQSCIRLTDHAFVFWHHTEERLLAHGFRGHVTVLAGLLPPVGQNLPSSGRRVEPTVLFAGRMIKDKGVRLLPDALRIAKARFPSLRLVLAGEGPERVLLERRCLELGLTDSVSFPGRLPEAELAELMATASCIVIASLREGYGLVVAEAAAAGTPSVVAANPENAATGHIVEDVNGFVVDPTASGLARGIVSVIEGGERLRESTAAWYESRADSMSMLRSANEMIGLYSSERIRRQRSTQVPR